MNEESLIYQPLEKMTKKDIKKWIKWAENEIFEYELYIKVLKEKLENR